MLILNAVGLQIRPSGIYLVALQMLILNAVGLQIRPSGLMDMVLLIGFIFMVFTNLNNGIYE